MAEFQDLGFSNFQIQIFWFPIKTTFISQNKHTFVFNTKKICHQYRRRYIVKGELSHFRGVNTTFYTSQNTANFHFEIMYRKNKLQNINTVI